MPTYWARTIAVSCGTAAPVPGTMTRLTVCSTANG